MVTIPDSYYGSLGFKCRPGKGISWLFHCYSQPVHANSATVPQIKQQSLQSTYFCFYLAQQPPVGHCLLIHEVSRSHTTNDSLVAETSTWQHTTLTTDIHASHGIRTHNLRRRATADLRLRPAFYILYIIVILPFDDTLTNMSPWLIRYLFKSLVPTRTTCSKIKKPRPFPTQRISVFRTILTTNRDNVPKQH